MNNTLAHTGNQPVNRLHGIDSGLTATKGETSTTEESSHSTTLSQRVAICFAAGVLGALAVLLFSHVLSWFGPGPKGPIQFPASFEPPGIYRPLFWGGLWGLLFGFFIKPVWNRHYLVGFLYFLVSMAARPAAPMASWTSNFRLPGARVPGRILSNCSPPVGPLASSAR